MTEKTVFEHVKCTTKDAPQKSLEKAIEILRNHPEVQAAIKDKVVCAMHVNQGSHALQVVLDFIDADIVTGDPLQRLNKGLAALADLVAKSIKEGEAKIKAAIKEDEEEDDDE